MRPRPPCAEGRKKKKVRSTPYFFFTNKARNFDLAAFEELSQGGPLSLATPTSFSFNCGESRSQRVLTASACAKKPIESSFSRDCRRSFDFDCPQSGNREPR